MVGAAVAVLAEGAAELADHHHHGVGPLRAHLVGKQREALAQLRQLAGQLAGGAAFADMGVPAADVDEAQAHPVAHQPCHAARLQRKALGRDGAAAGSLHFAGHLARHFVAHLEAAAHRARQPRAGIHAGDGLGLAGADGRFAEVAQRLVGHRQAAAQDQRHLVGEGHGLQAGSGAEHAGEPVHEAAAEVPRRVVRLAEFDVVLRLEMAARGVVGAGKGHKAGLALLPQRLDAVGQRRGQAPAVVQRQGGALGDRDVRPRLVVEAGGRGHQQIGRVIGAAQEHDEQPRRAGRAGP
mmetsp:Transcript_1050/g.2781  ORF Transcript_1050/g.2781 Transcript_1050/m.2781 type:complete len:295 (-) Transcript_1050:1016-1900(-)